MNLPRIRTNSSGTYRGIVTFTILVIGIGWAALLLYLRDDQQRVVAATMQANANLARTFEEHTVRTIKQIDQLVLLVRAQYQRLGPRLDLARFAREAGANPELVVIVAVLDGNGDAVITNSPAPPANVADRDHFKFHAQNDSSRLIIGKPVLGRLGGRWLMPMSRRINKPDGSFGGVVSIGVDPFYFSNFYRDIDLGRDGLVVLAGNDGFVRSRLSGQEPSAGQEIRNSPIVNAIGRNPQGSLIFASVFDGSRRIGSYRMLREFPLYVAVGVSETEALATHNHLRRSSYAAGAIATLVILAFCGWLLRIETREQKARAALRSAHAEVEALNAKLFAANDDLECRVAERTAEVEIANRSLRESENRFRTLIEWSPEPIAVHRAGKVIYVNPAAVQLVGANSANGMIGKSLLDFVHPDFHQIVAARAREAIERHVNLPMIEERILKLDGTVMDVEVQSRSIDYDGEPAVLVSMRDVTEHKRAKDELLRQDALLNTILKSASEAIFAKDMAGRYRFINEAGARMLGRQPAEIIGRTDEELLPADMARAFHRTDEYVMSSGNTYESEPVGVISGEQRAFIAHKTPWRDGLGRIVGVIGVSNDVTERKQLEEQLRESQKMEALGTLAGGVAHDFNNIVAAIIGNVDLARQDVGAAHPAQESLEEIRKASQRAKALVRQILAFSRRHVLERKVISLTPVLEETAKLLRVTLPAGVKLSVECAHDAPTVLADATQVEQVLLNLCGNAWHAVQGQERTGKIEIRLDAELRNGLRFAALTVRDNGCGMDDATRNRVFEPFFTTKPVGEGTGLGLAVVHGIVKEHDASIDVRSAPGVGTTFVIRFPAARTDAALVQAPEKAAAAATDDQALVLRGGGRRILYVDDDEAIVFLVTRMMKRQGYRVRGYTDAREALTAVRANPDEFDLVVTDFNMPGMSGLEVARALKMIRADLPVALTSGYLTEELREQAPGAGVSELIYKPNTVEDLCEVVARLATARGENEGVCCPPA